MEFKSLKNIETSFRQIRLFGIVVVSLCAMVAIAAVVLSLNFADKRRSVMPSARKMLSQYFAAISM